MKVSYEYVMNNYHKFSEQKRIDIALSMVLHGKLPKGRFEKRERNDKRHTAWRKKVYERDNYTCQECFVEGGRLEAHHILKWADYPKSRYHLSNGKTLCKECHSKTSNYGLRNNGLHKG
mgnify:CR=1 FL=1